MLQLYFDGSHALKCGDNVIPEMESQLVLAQNMARLDEKSIKVSNDRSVGGITLVLTYKGVMFGITGKIAHDIVIQFASQAHVTIAQEIFSYMFKHMTLSQIKDVINSWIMLGRMAEFTMPINPKKRAKT